MRLYVFRCTGCGASYESRSPIPDFCCQRCSGSLRRDYSTFSVKSSFQPHFNHSIGQYVTSAHQFDEALKVASHTQSAAGGHEVSLERVDPRDMEPPPGAAEQAEATEKVKRAKGMSEPKKLIIP